MIRPRTWTVHAYPSTGLRGPDTDSSEWCIEHRGKMKVKEKQVTRAYTRCDYFIVTYCIIVYDIFKLFSLKNVFLCSKTPDQSTDGKINRQMNRRTDWQTDRLIDRQTDGHNILQRCVVVANKKKEKKTAVGVFNRFWRGNGARTWF